MGSIYAVMMAEAEHEVWAVKLKGHVDIINATGLRQGDPESW